MFNLTIPEEKRFITDIPKTEYSNEIKVIPKEYTVLDKINLIGPQLSVKNIVEYFNEKFEDDNRQYKL